MNLDSLICFKSKLQKGKGLFCKSEKDLIHSVRTLLWYPSDIQIEEIGLLNMFKEMTLIVF